MTAPVADDLDGLHNRPSQLPDQKQKYGDPEEPELAPLLSLPPEEAARHLYLRWKNYPKEKLQRERAECQVNQWRMDGRTNCYVQKTQDQNRWMAWSPPWNAPPVPVLNKAKRLCRRLTSIVWSDPPVPESAREDGEEGDQEATEFALRVLNDLQGEGQLDDLRNARRAFYRACAYKRGYVRYYADPRGGGKKPVRIMAKPGAQTADQPFTDPQTGSFLEGELICRYVKEDGTLTDKAAEAATRWMPAVKQEPLHSMNVRVYPHDAEDIWSATDVVIGTMPTWGELLDLWPEELANLSDDDKKAIFAFKPENPKDLLGFGTEKVTEQKGMNEREKRVPVFMAYCKAGAYYPDGAYAVVLADRVMLHRQTWISELDGKREELDIPLTEYSQFEGGDGLMDLLGSGNEIRAAQVGHLLAYLDQFTNRKVFIPTNSILQPKSYQLMQGTAIAINPGGEPKFEEIPNFPSAPLDCFTMMTEEMNDQSGLQETAQGTEVPGVNSGAQASIVVAQSQAGLSDVQQNVSRGWLRGCRITLQQARITYTVPQQIGWEGDDGQYRQKWWTGADLRSGMDIRLKRGSLSMMTPAQKLNLVMQFKQFGAYDQSPDLFFQSFADTLGPTVGFRDDPAKQRIKRQISAWSDGPPEGWQPPQAPTDPMGQPIPQVDPATGQPVLDQNGQPVPQPPPPDPALSGIWQPVQADELQDVATIRLIELKRFMASTRYTRWPAEWRLGVDQEFAHMKQCAGVMTVMEQQQMQQQQADQQAQQQAQEADKQRQHDTATAEQQQGSEQQKHAQTAEQAKAQADQQSQEADKQRAHEEKMKQLEVQATQKPGAYMIERDPSGRATGLRAA